MSDHDALSESGRKRRDAMLRELKAAVVRRRRRRTAARWSIAAAVPLAVTILFVFAGPRVPVAPAPVDPVSAAPFARLDFEVVHNDPDIVERHAISDEELIALLSEANHPAGLIRIHGQVLLAEY